MDNVCSFNGNPLMAGKGVRLWRATPDLSNPGDGIE
jgi:hypothetical protein